MEDHAHQHDLFADLEKQALASEGPPAELPYRVSFRTVSDDQIAQINREHGFKGARAYLPVEHAVEMASEAKSLIDARLTAFLEHPDERVPCALMQNRRSKKPWGIGARAYDRGKLVRDTLYQRAMDEAERDGVVWTQMLDTLASRRLWPYVNYQGQSYTFAPQTNRPTRALISPYDQAAKLIPWIEAQTDPALIHPLLNFGFDRIAELVARHTACLDDSLLDRLLKQWRLGRDIARNRFLTDAQVRKLIDWALELLKSKPASVYSRRDYEHSARYGADTLVALHEPGHRIDAATRDALMDMVKPKPTKYRYGYSNRYIEISTSEAALSALLGLEDLEPERLLALYETLKGEQDHVMSIIKHPAATVEIWRHVATTSGFFPVREYLSKQPAALEDETIRASLAKSSSASVLAGLAFDASPDEFAKYFRLILRRDASEAFRILQRDGFDTSKVPLAEIIPMVEGKLHFPDRRSIRAPSENAFRLNVLLWLRGKRLADDPRDEPGRTAEAYVVPRLQPIVRNAFESDERLALELMENHANQIRDMVSPADLLNVLQSENQRVRIAAMTLLAELRTAPTEERSRSVARV